MMVTRETIVKDVVDKIPTARAIFERHGVNPTVACRSIWRRTTLGEAEDCCFVDDLDELIDELNEAASQSAR